MSRVVSVVVGGLLLGGCALPVPLQIASWALDGISLLATQKSITDHGISAVAQQDCALWRGVTEGTVCREDDPMAIMVAQGDVVGSDTPVESGTALTSLKAMLSSSDLEPAQPVQSSWSNKQKTAPEVNDKKLIQFAADGLSEGMAEPQTEPLLKPLAEAKLDATPELQTEDQALQWQFVSQETVSIATDMAGFASYRAIPGDYFVIGSFGVWDNAKRYMEKYPALDARILAANVGDYRVFRIVVGPYNEGSQRALRRSIRDAGIEDIWAVRVPFDENTMAWRFSDSSPEMASASIPD